MEAKTHLNYFYFSIIYLSFIGCNYQSNSQDIAQENKRLLSLIESYRSEEIKLFNSAKELYKQGQLKQAKEILLEVKKRYPNSPNNRTTLKIINRITTELSDKNRSPSAKHKKKSNNDTKKEKTKSSKLGDSALLRLKVARMLNTELGSNKYRVLGEQNVMLHSPD